MTYTDIYLTIFSEIWVLIPYLLQQFLLVVLIKLLFSQKMFRHIIQAMSQSTK